MEKTIEITETQYKKLLQLVMDQQRDLKNIQDILNRMEKQITAISKDIKSMRNRINRIDAANNE